MKESKGTRTRNDLIKLGGIVTDKEMPIYLLSITGIIKAPSYSIKRCTSAALDPITLDMLNAVTHVAYRQWISHKAVELWFSKSPEEIISLEVFKDFNCEWPHTFNTVFIKESEINTILGKNYDPKFIYKHMKNIGLIAFDGTLPVFWKEGGWKELDVSGGFADVKYVTENNAWDEHREWHKKGIHKGKEKRIWVIEFIGSWGQNFALNILNKRVRIFPKLTYEKLSFRARHLCKLIFGGKNNRGRITLPQMRILFGWKGDWGNVSHQISKVNKIWKELKLVKAISNPNIKGKGENIRWNWERNNKFFFFD